MCWDDVEMRERDYQIVSCHLSLIPSCTNPPILSVCEVLIFPAQLCDNILSLSSALHSLSFSRGVNSSHWGIVCVIVMSRNMRKLLQSDSMNTTLCHQVTVSVLHWEVARQKTYHDDAMVGWQTRALDFSCQLYCLSLSLFVSSVQANILCGAEE